MGQALIGLDIGYLYLRAVRLARAGTAWRWVQHAEVPRYDDAGEPKSLPRCLVELGNVLDLRGRLIVAASDVAVMVRFEHNDPMPPDRLERVLRLELSQAAGLDGDGDLAADAVPVPLDGAQIIHCCGLAQPSPMLSLLADLKKQGLVPALLQLPPAGMANLLPPFAEIDADGTQLRLLVDIGARSTRVLLARGGDFLACRQLSIGGDTFTEQLGKIRNLPFDAAEELKINGGGSDNIAASAIDDDEELVLDTDDSAPPPIALPVPDVLSSDVFAPLAATDPGRVLLDNDDDRVAPVSEEDGAQPLWRRSGMIAAEGIELPQPGQLTARIGVQQLGPELVQVAEDLYGQLAKTRSWFQVQLKLKELPIAEVLLTGGGSQLVGLLPYLQRRFGASCRVAELPVAGAVAGDTPADAHAYAQALGLALAGRPGAVAFDLRPESHQRGELIRQQVAWPWMAAAMLLVGTGVLVWAILLGQETTEARIQVYQSHKQAYDDAEARRKALRAEETALKEDLRAIASRIFAGRDLLDAIRGLKMHAPKTLWITELSTSPLSVKTAGVPGQPAGTSRATPPPVTPATDRTIDRGSIWVHGYLRPQDGAQFEDLYSHLLEWYRSIQQHQTIQRHSVLFTQAVPEHDDIYIWPDPADPTKEQRGREFILRFEFRPTTIDEWVAAAGADAAPERP